MKLKDFEVVATWKQVIENIDRVTGGKYGRYQPDIELAIVRLEEDERTTRPYKLPLPNIYIHEFLTTTRQHAVDELKKLGVDE